MREVDGGRSGLGRAPGRLIAGVAAVVLLLVATVVGAPAVSSAAPAPRPIIFVHGFAGSGNQFESQAMRFASNGYPVDWIEAHEYDSLFAEAPREEVWAQLDARIADLTARAGTDQVDLIGHSLGTSVSQGYLNSSPERAASVAHYVNLDGFPAGALPGGVPTLAVWGMGSPAREVVGGTNVYLPEQTHTQTVTSPETFAAIFEFLTGAPAATTDVVREPDDQIEIAGRAVLFPSNVGVSGATVNLFQVDPDSGTRLDEVPEASSALSGAGEWGPFAVSGAARYELEVRRSETNAHHFYFESFVRDSHLMRLLTADPGTGLDALWERGPDHSNMTIVRNKEWWGDQGDRNDLLTIDGVNILNAATAPISKRAIGVFAYDVGADGVTSVEAPIPTFFALPFITGVDVAMAATTPPDRTIAVVETPRLGDGRAITIHVPNWASDNDRISLQFYDFHHVAAAAPPVAPPPAVDPPAPPVRTASATPRFTG